MTARAVAAAAAECWGTKGDTHAGQHICSVVAAAAARAAAAAAVGSPQPAAAVAAAVDVAKALADVVVWQVGVELCGQASVSLEPQGGVVRAVELLRCVADTSWQHDAGAGRGQGHRFT